VPTLGETIRVLAEERVLGESAAVLVKRSGAQDSALFADGEQLYTEAQAAFNGLIAQLQVELAEARKPSESQTFAQALEAAVERRKALFTFVDERIPHGEGTKDPLAILAGAVGGNLGELISSVTEAAVALWEAFRHAQQERRDDIRARLEAERWRPFAEAAGP
jgi:hypothetical protein